jgi:Ca2+-binding EF-hand superfamily protein
VVHSLPEIAQAASAQSAALPQGALLLQRIFPPS